MTTEFVEELLLDFAIYDGREKQLTLKRQHILKILELIRGIREDNSQLRMSLEQYLNRIDHLQEVVDSTGVNNPQYREFRGI